MFKIFKIPDDAAFDIEQIGTRRKFWVDLGGERFLFKEGRLNTGENWSEKIASEICKLLGIPHATYEFAIWKGMKGVLSPNFVPKEARLVLGNELLAKFFPKYETSLKFRDTQHTLWRVLGLIKSKAIEPPIGWSGKPDIETAVEVFLGYLMLDALIANQDRHHLNWGIIIIMESGKPKIHLAPSFDHASSLGRNETDTVRQERLITKDMGRNIQHYVERAQSAFFLSPSDKKPLSTIDVFYKTAQRWPRAARSWLNNLELMSSKEIDYIFGNVPKTEITPIAIEFAKQILSLNKNRLLELEGI
ncbi:MAG: HipA domain-containing protein [Desulfobaccales bacterium]